MLHALSIFTQREPYTLPLSPTLPDLKSDTTSYIHLQNLYKTQARVEKAQFVQILEEVQIKAGVPQPIPSVLVDEFVKNCHQLKILKGKQCGDEADATLRKPSDRICSPCVIS
jgi:amyloid beta precursor protein binding protein 1